MRHTLRKAREEQLLKKIRKACSKSSGDWVTLEAVGTKERDELLCRGWEVVLQDVSERGAWVKCYLMRKRRAIALVA